MCALKKVTGRCNQEQQEQLHMGRKQTLKNMNLSHLFCGQVKDLETHLQRLKSELHKCVSFIQDPRKLKDSVQMIYARYVGKADGVSGSYTVVDADGSWHQESNTVQVQLLLPLY